MNSYQIIGKLATGGMAEIFLVRCATGTGIERYCVLKRILPEHAQDTQFVQMFLDEARLAAQLQHPNIASVYDIGQLDDGHFYTMEYVHGETFRSLLQGTQELRRSLPLSCVLTMVAGVAAALHHAHERRANDGRALGIVHRDVSLSNVMVSYEGNVKLVDFGVAKAANRAIRTKTGTVKGKISYLSPEQCRGQEVDRRSDLFSLGVVMWEMLTGQRLYQRATDFDSMSAIATEPAPRPSSRRSGIPGPIDHIVLRLLAKPAHSRFQTAAEVVDAIENAAFRAGMLLSTAAVSRMMYDLLGPRAEPWRQREFAPVPDDSSTLAPPPIAALASSSPTDETRAYAPAEPPAVAGSAAPARHGAPTLSVEVAASGSGSNAGPVAPVTDPLPTSRVEATTVRQVVPAPWRMPGVRPPGTRWITDPAVTPGPAGHQIARILARPRIAWLLVAATCLLVFAAIAIGIGLGEVPQRVPPGAGRGGPSGVELPQVADGDHPRIVRIAEIVGVGSTVVMRRGCHRA